MKNYQEALAQAAQFIHENDHFLVVSHVFPDGDATGSVLATGHLLQVLGKEYVMVNEGPSPRRFSYLNGFDQIINLSNQPNLRPFRAVITVDVADWDRLGSVGALIQPDHPILNIDHHPTNTCFGQVNLINSEAASTTQILYQLCQAHFNQAFNADLAEALYTGLLTDTGGFRYANTDQTAFHMAADLLSHGLDPAQIASYALETISLGHIKILRKALDSLTFAFDGQVALILISQEAMREAEAERDDTDGLAGYPIKISGVQVGVLLKEMQENEIKISLRSKGSINVAKLAQEFGGGGHAKAAGFTYQGTLNEAKEAILANLSGVLSNTEEV